ncbi:MAG: hypothetical protein HGA61_04490 [Candidatus Moranbacteria bacterium]|nr:hypothetical protein [Candidatus Moranbacteria bacterium]
MKKNSFFSYLASTLLLVGFFLFLQLKKTPDSAKENQEKEIADEKSIQFEIKAELEDSEKNFEQTKLTDEAKEIPSEKESLTKQQVPFVIQAPFGNWKEADFQNACEEASIVMAMGWIKGEKEISPEKAGKRILEIVDFENKNFGYSTDNDIFDLEKIFKEYFNHQNVLVKNNADIENIKTEIQKGNIVIVPVFGQALKNPNFTQPGPIAHMLVILGYDPTTKEFITNDPGTRKGAGYRYGENLLFAAVWEYPSGKNLPLPPKAGEMAKRLISISK